jgi:hypothetical protein
MRRGRDLSRQMVSVRRQDLLGEVSQLGLGRFPPGFAERIGEVEVAPTGGNSGDVPESESRPSRFDFRC